MEIETCIIEIKKAIARIEEQTKTIFNILSEHRDWAEKLHKEHFDDTDEIRKSISDLNARLSRHDAELCTMKRSIEHLMGTLEEQIKIILRTRGIATGLGMAGGAIVSILAILVQIIK